MTAEGDRNDGNDDTEAQQGSESRTGVVVVTTEAERRDAFAVRKAVFVDEQGVDESIELDEHDKPRAEATHFVAYDDGDVVGAARFRPTETDSDTPSGKVERVAVAADRRGEDWGRALMDRVESYARECGVKRILLHAQMPVQAFYESLGYDPIGETFEEAGIQHIKMTKRL